MSNSKTVAANLLFWVNQCLNKPIYKNIQIKNFTTSWKDGLAFCALVHSNNSTVFNYTKLESKNQKANLELAFSTAKTHLGVEPLLDADDFLILDKPDRRSVMTYVMMIRKGISTSAMMMRKIGKSEQQVKPKLPNSTTIKPKPKLVLFDTRSKPTVTTTDSKNNSNTAKDKNETSITSIKKTLSIKTRARRRSSVGNNISLGRVIGTSATARTGSSAVASKTNQSDNTGTTNKAPTRPSPQISPTSISITKSDNNNTTNDKSSPVSNAITTTKDGGDGHIGDEFQASQCSNAVLKSGWMLKAGKLNTALKNRYFILKPSSLTWYKQIPILMNENLRNTLTEEDILLEEKKVQTKKEQYQGRIRINDIKSVNIVIDKDIAIEKQYMLELVTKKRILKMYALSPDVVYDWKDALSNSICELYKYKKQLSLSKIKNSFIIIDDNNEDEDEDNTRNSSNNDSVSRSSWNKRISKIGATGRLSTFSLDYDNDMNDAFPHVPAINKLTDELSSLIQIIGFNCDSLSFELRRVGVEEEKGILAIINSLSKKLNHATDIQKQLLSETTSHSSYMSKIREQSIQNWMKSSDVSSGTIIEGYLKKCDFKRKTDIRTWYASRGDMKYQTRWFSLEKNTGILKYYKENPDILLQKKRNSIFRVDSNTNVKPKGVLSLKDKNIQYVRKSEAPKAPPFSFDLVSSTNIFTLIATSLEEQIAWCTVLTRQLKKINNERGEI
jgi:hypothetical protein